MSSRNVLWAAVAAVVGSSVGVASASSTEQPSAGAGAIGMELDNWALGPSAVYFFDAITNNTVGDPEAGESQLSVEVTPGPGANQVSFTFSNTGAAAMSITDVYFDDGTLLGIASITNGPGVSFSQGASPGDLPSGNNASPPFDSTAGFDADSDPPAQPNGVNPGEFLTITFNLLAGVTYNDTITALNTPGDHLRIGIHVQGFASGGSEAFVNLVPSSGTTVTLVLAGLIAGRRRR